MAILPNAKDKSSKNDKTETSFEINKDASVGITWGKNDTLTNKDLINGTITNLLILKKKSKIEKEKVTLVQLKIKGQKIEKLKKKVL
jgi:hypothetical protein